MNVINADADATTIVLAAGIGMLAACTVIVFALDYAFHRRPPRDTAATNPYGITHVDDLMTLADVANRAVRDDLANKPRIGELIEQDLDALVYPPHGTLPPVRRPTILQSWRASGRASGHPARHAAGWERAHEFDRTAADLAQFFREQEGQR